MNDFLNKEMLKIAKSLAEKEIIKCKVDSLMMTRVAKYEEKIKTLNENNARLVE